MTKNKLTSKCACNLDQMLPTPYFFKTSIICFSLEKYLQSLAMLLGRTFIDKKIKKKKFS